MALSPKWCVLCNANCESMNHIFIHCAYAKNIWNNVFWKASSALGHARKNHGLDVSMDHLGY